MKNYTINKKLNNEQEPIPLRNVNYCNAET